MERRVLLCRKRLPDRRTVWPWFQARDRLRSRDEQGMPNNQADQTLERIDGLNAGDLCLMERFQKRISHDQRG